MSLFPPSSFFVLFVVFVSSCFNPVPSEPDRAAVRARFAARDVGTICQAADDLALAEEAAAVVDLEDVPARGEAVQDVLWHALLDRDLAPLHPLPARGVEARLRVHPVVGL